MSLFFTFPNLSRRHFLTISSRILTLSVLTACQSQKTIQDNDPRLPHVQKNPLNIGFIGNDEYIQYYADLITTIPKTRLVSADKAQAVIISVPLQERARWVKHALQTGKHILVDIPL